MDFIRLAALLIFTFGIFSFGAVFVLWLRRLFQTRGFTTEVKSPVPHCMDEWVAGAITFLSFTWFLVGLLLVLASFNPEIRSYTLMSISLFQVFLFPPLIVHSTYVETIAGDQRRTGEASPTPPLGIGFRMPIWALYIVSPSIALFSLLGYYEFLPLSASFLNRFAGLSIAFLFGSAMIYSFLVLSRKGKSRETEMESKSRKWILGLFVFVFLMCILMVLAHFGYLEFSELMDVTLRSIPLLFLFVSTYFESRFEFFDRLIKRGLALFVTILILTAYFSAVLPSLEVVLAGGKDTVESLRRVRPFLYAIVLLPVILAMPWLYRKIGEWVDNFWLGRKFTTIDAVKFFLSTLQKATTERQLVQEGEKGISTIFHAEVRIDLDLRAARGTTFEVVQEIPIRSGEKSMGVLRLGQRTGRTPFFSEDVALLTSLGEVFAFLLENVRLQQKKQEQEKLAQDLSLRASRSELKALRAQINPHFLFNALNAIAGLIHKNPLRADKTVEQLAEVFRYTLRRSESEWSRMEDELEFVRAYLEVEQARFGSRLEFRIDVEDSIRSAKIPTMVVQTLVENALKHGVAAVRGPGKVEVRGYRDGKHMRIEVGDNGPGFDPESPSTPSPDSRKGSGYGLKNVRERLQGHFGQKAGLEISRNEERKMTMVTVWLPFTHQSAATETSGASRQ